MTHSTHKEELHAGTARRFDPPDWGAFFAEHGWQVEALRYLGDESLRLHRPVPMPLFVKVLRAFASKGQMLRNTSYAVLARDSGSPFEAPDEVCTCQVSHLV
jgi:hypothetical protein